MIPHNPLILEIMKKYLFTILFICCSTTIFADDQVTFEISDGLQGALKTKIEQQLSKLLTAINTAATANSDELNFRGIQFESSETANQTICALWSTVHFRTQDDDFYENCLCHKRAGRVIGYQIRNIYMDMEPVDDSYQEDLSQEFVIDFDAQGRISDVNIAMNKLQYQELLKAGEQLNDLDRREQVIFFCEQFANAYRKYDIQYMKDIFSDDALIITGRVREKEKANVVMRNPEVNLPQQKNVEYTVQTKEEYINNLNACFNKQRNTKGGFINVKFDEYRVVRHPAKPNYYGVTLKQSWSSKGYHDEGIVFIVWNFNDEERPKIEVRTWQAMSTEEREIFTLNNFKLR